MFVACERCPYDAEGRAVAGRGQGAGVTVREDGVAGLEQAGSVSADAQAALDVVVVDLLSAREQGGGQRLRLRRLRRARLLPDLAHLTDRPADVDGRRPRGGQPRGSLFEGVADGRQVGADSSRLASCQSQCAGRSDTECRRAPHRHVDDALRQLLPGGAAHVLLLVR